MGYDTKTMRIVWIFHALVNGEHLSMRECAKDLMSICALFSAI
ncbi:hypothetical protein [Helicobacter canis]|nr:hypothetical protein [Helicobacter canis]